MMDHGVTSHIHAVLIFMLTADVALILTLILIILHSVLHTVDDKTLPIRHDKII